jgi:hypothetical protein
MSQKVTLENAYQKNIIKLKIYIEFTYSFFETETIRFNYLHNINNDGLDYSLYIANIYNNMKLHLIFNGTRIGIYSNDHKFNAIYFHNEQYDLPVSESKQIKFYTLTSNSKLNLDVKNKLNYYVHNAKNAYIRISTCHKLLDINKKYPDYDDLFKKLCKLVINVGESEYVFIIIDSYYLTNKELYKDIAVALLDYTNIYDFSLLLFSVQLVQYNLDQIKMLLDIGYDSHKYNNIKENALSVAYNKDVYDFLKNYKRS